MARYLLDSNIYIDFYDRYYRFTFFPSFWDSFKEIMNNHVVIPKIVVEEQFQDEWFRQWVKANYQHSITSHTDHVESWIHVLNHINQSPLYSDAALSSDKGWAKEKIADPWLIAIAKDLNLTLVTSEMPNTNLSEHFPSKSAKIPDVCNSLGIPWMDRNAFFEMVALSI